MSNQIVSWDAVKKRKKAVYLFKDQRFDVTGDNVTAFVLTEFPLEDTDTIDVFIGTMRLKTIDYTITTNQVTISNGVYGSVAKPTYVVVRKYNASI